MALITGPTMFLLGIAGLVWIGAGDSANAVTDADVRGAVPPA